MVLYYQLKTFPAVKNTDVVFLPIVESVVVYYHVIFLYFISFSFFSHI